MRKYRGQRVDTKELTFKEVCNELGIEKYTERIFKSNSCGELGHLADYHMFLEMTKKDENFKNQFLSLFEIAVSIAEKNWKRPSSIFQHIPKMFDAISKEINQNL